MPDSLSFRLHVKRGAEFSLDIAERFPLHGITAVSGPSGSGKTTLLRTLAGLDADLSGDRSIRFGGKVWDDGQTSLPPEDRRVGMVFQEPALFPHLTIAENIGYGARRRGVSSVEAIVEALDLGPMMDRAVTGLSGGEARRVSLARALASNPAIIFLDEPMTGLDARRRSDFLPYIARAVNAARVPAVYVTHSAEEITTLADRVLGIEDGRSVGWQMPPMRLTGKVIGSASEGMTVRLSDPAGTRSVDIVTPIRAFKGEAVGLGLLPESILLSAEHPGDSSALGVLPTEVIEQEGGDRGAKLKVLGQVLELAPSVALPKGTSEPWLSIMRALPRPQSTDS